MKQKEIIFYLTDKKFRRSFNGFIPFDESVTNRGRSIFDAIPFYDGVFFDIDAHLERTYNDTKTFGAPLEKIFSKEEFKEELERLKPSILKKFGKDTFFKLEVVVSRQSNIFLRALPLPRRWLDTQKPLVMIAVQYKYLLQNLKYCGRYAEPMILAELAREQIDPEIDECLFYSKGEKNGKTEYMALEATNSAFFVIDTNNRLWGAEPPNVLLSTSSRIIKKIAKQDAYNPVINEKEKISAVMPFGFPLNSSVCNIKEMFSSGAVRSLVTVKKLIFVDVKNDKSKIIVKRLKNVAAITINGKTPITDRLRERFRDEIKRYTKIHN